MVLSGPWSLKMKTKEVILPLKAMDLTWRAPVGTTLRRCCAATRFHLGMMFIARQPIWVAPQVGVPLPVLCILANG